MRLKRKHHVHQEFLRLISQLDLLKQQYKLTWFVSSAVTFLYMLRYHFSALLSLVLIMVVLYTLYQLCIGNIFRRQDYREIMPLCKQDYRNRKSYVRRIFYLFLFILTLDLFSTIAHWSLWAYYNTYYDVNFVPFKHRPYFRELGLTINVALITTFYANIIFFMLLISQPIRWLASLKKAAKELRLKSYYPKLYKEITKPRFYSFKPLNQISFLNRPTNFNIGWQRYRSQSTFMPFVIKRIIWQDTLIGITFVVTIFIIYIFSTVFSTLSLSAKCSFMPGNNFHLCAKVFFRNYHIPPELRTRQRSRGSSSMQIWLPQGLKYIPIKELYKFGEYSKRPAREWNQEHKIYKKNP